MEKKNVSRSLLSSGHDYWSYLKFYMTIFVLYMLMRHNRIKNNIVYNFFSRKPKS